MCRFGNWTAYEDLPLWSTKMTRGFGMLLSLAMAAIAFGADSASACGHKRYCSSSCHTPACSESPCCPVVYVVILKDSDDCPDPDDDAVDDSDDKDSTQMASEYATKLKEKGYTAETVTKKVESFKKLTPAKQKTVYNRSVKGKKK
jgi:hypothetical protein